MFTAFDVQYRDPQAAAAAVIFQGWDAFDPEDQVIAVIEEVEPYVPGEFYKRELPCLLAALEGVERKYGRPELLFVDGYVNLEPGHPGLGRRLYDAVGIPVVGVAKTRFHQAAAVEILRGSSKSPLFITAVGMDAIDAAEGVMKMRGAYRIPTMLQLADQLARAGAKDLI